jgi:cation transport regulator
LCHGNSLTFIAAAVRNTCMNNPSREAWHEHSYEYGAVSAHALMLRQGITHMPYAFNENLPPGVRHVLPDHAQSIYREAFNHAWERYRDHSGEREAISHRIAWAAVKRSYQKVDEVWVPI